MRTFLWSGECWATSHDKCNANKCDSPSSSEYEVTQAPGQVIDYEVRDTKQHILSKKEDISRGKFSFTSEVFDVYELCFVSKVPHSE
jgi:hypothetical protein